MTTATRSGRHDAVLVPGGTFRMGSNQFYPEEGPVRTAVVPDLWVDEHPVTNAAFRRFVKATGHLTIAERAPDPADFPDADPTDLVPGSLVFRPTAGPVPLDDWTAPSGVARGTRPRWECRHVRTVPWCGQSRHP